MADIVFNVAKGRLAQYGDLSAAADALIMVPLELTGLVADSVMRDYTDLAAIIAGASNEQTGVGRKTLASVTVTVDQTNDRVAIDCANVVWTAPPAGNAVGAVVICYDGDTGAGTDSNIIPLTKHDVTWTPDTNDFTLTVTDFAWAS